MSNGDAKTVVAHQQGFLDDDDVANYILVRQYSDNSTEVVANGFSNNTDPAARRLEAMENARRNARDDEARALLAEALRIARGQPPATQD